MDFYDSELHARDRVVLTDLQDVFGIDALESSLPISVEVTNPSYDMTYSRLSYGKGNCLLRMVENIITRDVFNTGINQYLSRNMYGNANRYDLWSTLNEVAQLNGTLDSTQDLSDIMEEWTSTPGYPVVNVHSTDNENEVTLVQQRFFSNPDTSAADSAWHIPISFAYPGESGIPSTKPSLWMTNEDFSLTTTVTQKPFILNVKQTGYYRVNYGDDLWDLLTEVLHTDMESVDPLNRAQMIDDSLNIARSGQLAYEVALGLTKYATGENHYIPIKSTLNNFVYLDEMFKEESSSDYEALQNYLTSLYGQLYIDYGFDAQGEEEFLDSLIREEMISWMCAYNFGDCVSQANTLFASWMDEQSPDDSNPIPADIKAPVYSTAIAYGGAAEWNFLWDRFLAATVDNERLRIIVALGNSKDESTISNLLDMTISADSGIRKQDVGYVHSSVGSTATGRTLQFTWMEDNFIYIMEYHGTGLSNVVSSIVSSFASGAKTQAEAERIQNFYDTYKSVIAGADNIFNPAIETTTLNMKWMENNFNIVLEWFLDNIMQTTPTTDSTTTTSGSGDTTTTQGSGDTTTTSSGSGDTTTTTTQGSGDTTTTSNSPTTTPSGNGSESTVVNMPTLLLLFLGMVLHRV